MKITFVALLLTSAFVFCYSYFIEPYTLEVSHHKVKLDGLKQKIVIAHLTDLHSDQIGPLEKKYLAELAKVMPDIIVITGDLATPNGNSQGYLELLKQIKAPLGTYFVMGNWEYWAPIDDLDQILKKANIINLTNQAIKIDDDLWLVGFDDEPTGTPEIKILEKIPNSSNVVSLFHSPIFFNTISQRVDLAFAGHSHGGQFRLPFFGAAWFPEGTGEYQSGWYAKDRAKMYVSRGLGTSILSLRFNCKPELAFINLFY